MLILKIFLLTLIGIVLFYLYGVSFENLFKKELSLCAKPVVGFILFLGGAELLCWWMVAYRFPTRLFEIAILIFMAVLTIPSWKHLSESFSLDWKKARKALLPALPLILIVVLIMILTQLYMRSDADDAFYVANSLLFDHTGILNPYEGSFGQPQITSVPIYDFEIWEALFTVLSRWTGLEVATLAHTAILPLLYLLSACSCVFLGEALFKGQTSKALQFSFFFFLACLFAGYAVYTQGSFLLSRLWQGKAVYLLIVFPALSAILLDAREYDLRLTSTLALCILAGLALNPTSIYIVGGECVALLCWQALSQKSLKPLISCILSVLIIGVFSVLVLIRNGQVYENSSIFQDVGASFPIDEMKRFLGEKPWTFLLYLIGCVLILFRGNRREKYYFIYVPAIILVLILNPWTGKLIAEHIVGIPTFWRLFWLIPIPTGIACASVLLVSEMREGWRQWAGFLLCALLIIFCGRYMFTAENGFTRTENSERLPVATLELGRLTGDGDGENAMVLAEDLMASTLRQAYASPELVYSRNLYLQDIFFNRGLVEEGNDVTYLKDAVNGNLPDSMQLIPLLDKYQVTDVLTRSDNQAMIDILTANNWYLAGSIESYSLYKKAS